MILSLLSMASDKLHIKIYLVANALRVLKSVSVNTERYNQHLFIDLHESLEMLTDRPHKWRARD